MDKKIEMVCVSDIEGFDRELYEKTIKKLAKHLGKFGWKLEDCVFGKDGKVWSHVPHLHQGLFKFFPPSI